MPETAPPARGRGLLIGLFAVYLVLLVWLVVWKYEVPWVGDGHLRTIKLVPFAPSGDADSSTVREVVANVAFFVPFGLYLGLLAPTWRWWAQALVFAGASVVLEGVQYAIALGSSDVTDVITNTVGGLVGVAVVALMRRWLGGRTVAVMTWICAVGTALALAATVVFVASPMNYGPQQDASARASAEHRG